MKIPVAVAGQMLSGGGTERQLVEFAKAIDQTRFEPHVVHFRPDPAKEQELAAVGVQTHEVSVRSFATPKVLAHAWDLAAYLRRHRIRIYHAFDMPLAVFGVPVARLAGAPVVLSSIRGQRELYTPAFRKLLRFTDPMVNGIVANAASLVEDLASQGVPREKLHLCRNGLITGPFRRVVRKPGRPLTIGTVCVLRPEKNLELLLRAFAALLPDHASLRLRITGSGPMLPSLQELAATLRLGAAVSFHPATTDVPAALSELDIFVLPSFTEGLSNSIMEAMASRCAVAASAVGGNVELIEDGKTGVLFDPLQVGSLTVALRRLVDDAALRERVASAGSGKIEDQFSMAVSARTMEAIYDRFL